MCIWCCYRIKSFSRKSEKRASSTLRKWKRIYFLFLLVNGIVVDVGTLVTDSAIVIYFRWSILFFLFFALSLALFSLAIEWWFDVSNSRFEKEKSYEIINTKKMVQNIGKICKGRKKNRTKMCGSKRGKELNINIYIS